MVLSKCSAFHVFSYINLEKKREKIENEILSDYHNCRRKNLQNENCLRGHIINFAQIIMVFRNEQFMFLRYQRVLKIF